MPTLYDELTTGSLAAEIATHLNPANRNDAAITSIMNRKDIATKGKVSAHDIQRYFALVDLLLPIEASTSEPCKVATRVLEIFPILDLGNAMVLAKFTSVLDNLVADASIDFTETHKAALLAMGDILISRADQIGGASLTQISQALNEGQI